MSNRMLKPEEVAERIGVTERTLRRWKEKGEGPPFIKINSRVLRYPEKELNEFLAPEDPAKQNTEPAVD